MAILTDDLLLTQRIGIGRDALHAEPTDLTELLRDVTARIAKDAPHRRLVMDVSDPLSILADRQLIDEVLVRGLGLFRLIEVAVVRDLGERPGDAAG